MNGHPGSSSTWQASQGRWRCAECRSELHQRYWSANREAQNALRAERKRQVRLEALSAYGGKCRCCGESDERFLAFDHVNNDGNTHRRATGRYAIHLVLKRDGYPKGVVQILCHNCNFAKTFYPNERCHSV